MGNHSIFKLAQEAKEKTEKAIEEEQKDMNTLVSKIDSILNNEVEAPEGSLLAMYRQAVKDKCENQDGNCTRTDHLHPGDYVDYQEPTTGSYTVVAKKSGTEAAQTYTLSATKNNVNWRVLGVDNSTGGIKLIAADPIQAGEADGNSPYLKLKGAEAYVYGVNELDNICKMYLNEKYATKARSVTNDDIDEITGVITREKRRDTNYLTLEGWANYGDNMAVVDDTPEDWLKKKEGETVESRQIEKVVTSYGYPVFQSDEEAKKFFGETPVLTLVAVNNLRVYNMLFQDVSMKNGKAYYLATNTYASSESNSIWGLNMVVDSGFIMVHPCAQFRDNREIESSLAVRPIVILKPNILEQDVSKIEEPDSTWPGVNTTT